MSKLDVSGVAYLCMLDDYDDFIGRLITQDRHQYSIQATLHTCDSKGHEHDTEDEHTCCYEDTAQMMDLTISRLDDLSDEIVIQHVVKSGGDNCSLTSACVNFITDELLVGEKADLVVTKYISPELAGKGSLVCIGQMTINYPASQT